MPRFSSLLQGVRTRRVAVLATAGAVLVGAGGGAGAAVALSGSSGAVGLPASVLASVSSSGTSGPAPGHGLLGRLAHLAEHAVHAQIVVVQHGTSTTWTFDRGRLSGVTASELQLAEADGQSVSVAVSSTTKVLPKKVGSITNLRQGETVDVLGENGTAVVVLVPAGWTHAVRGTLSALSSSSLTVTTAKGAIDTFSVSSSTKVLPASVGGLSGLQDGQRVVVKERHGQALWIRVLPATATPGSSTGGSSTGGSSTGGSSTGTATGTVTASLLPGS